MLQDEEHQRHHKQHADGQHAERRIAGGRCGRRDDEGAENARGLAEDVVETVVFVGVRLGDDFAVI